jgi:hypothetical protein
MRVWCRGKVLSPWLDKCQGTQLLRAWVGACVVCVHLWVCVCVCVEEFRRERHTRSAEGRAGFMWDIV